MRRLAVPGSPLRSDSSAPHCARVTIAGWLVMASAGAGRATPHERCQGALQARCQAVDEVGIAHRVDQREVQARRGHRLLAGVEAYWR